MPSTTILLSYDSLRAQTHDEPGSLGGVVYPGIDQPMALADHREVLVGVVAPALVFYRTQSSMMDFLARHEDTVRGP